MRVNTFFTLLISLLSLPFAFAQSQLINVNDKGVMLDGYDVVALQVNQKATPGSYEHQATYNNAIYYFSTDKNK